MVPTIDISPFVGPGPATEDAKAKALDEIRTACLESGFFVITGHGVPEDLQQRALAMSKSFFALPLEEKLELSEKKAWGRSFRGYQIIGGEAYEAGKLPDLKEVRRLQTLPPVIPTNLFFRGFRLAYTRVLIILIHSDSDR